MKEKSEKRYGVKLIQACRYICGEPGCFENDAEGMNRHNVILIYATSTGRYLVKYVGSNVNIDDNIE